MYIERLELGSTDPSAQGRFYADVLGLPVHDTSAGEVEVTVGTSLLVFAPAPVDGNYRYHFAVNIPENRFVEAKAWLAERVPLLRDATGKNEFHFVAWNAHATYFLDPAGNIGEIIARHDQKTAVDRTFDGSQFAGISEICLAAADVEELAALLRKRIGVENYKGGSAAFTAVGDENGLFIVVPGGRNWYPDTGIPAEPLPLVATVRNEKGERFTLTGPNPYRVAPSERDG